MVSRYIHIRDWVVILVVQLCLVGCSADYFWDGTEWKWQVCLQFCILYRKLHVHRASSTIDQSNVTIDIWIMFSINPIRFLLFVNTFVMTAGYKNTKHKIRDLFKVKL